MAQATTPIKPTKANAARATIPITAKFSGALPPVRKKPKTNRKQNKPIRNRINIILLGGRTR